MNRKISGCSYNITFDEVNSRFFLLSARSVRVFDIETLGSIAKLSDIANPNQIFISHKNGIIAVKSTVGQFAFYSVKDFTFLGKMRLKGSPSTDPKFYYDEEENVIYGRATKETKNGIEFFIYRVYPETLTYTTIPLPQMEREANEGEKPYTYYHFHKYSKGSYYLIRNFYDVKNRRIYECSYGRYKEEGGTLVLRKKYISTVKRRLELLDVTEKENLAQIYDFSKKLDPRIHPHFYHFYRNERGLFLITSEAIYHLNSSGEFEEVYHAKYMSDYAEFRGCRYICTWEWCLVQDILHEHK
ncbi:MAG: hypothetical protein J1F71_01060 [Clostridiales bacterium]|nr:hypothetical protein [Clostridiales bacterium]